MADDEFKIEKGIAPPPRSRNNFPFEKMEIGDSFFVLETVVKYDSVAASVSNVKRKMAPKVFVARQAIDAGGRKGTRVWRIADVAASQSGPTSQTQP